MNKTLLQDVDTALDRYEIRVNQNRASAAKTEGTFYKLWTGFVGSDSSAAAVRSSAAGDDSLLRAFRAKRAKLKSDAEAADLLRSVNDELRRKGLDEVVSFLSPAGGAAYVAKESVKDIKTGLKFGLPSLALIALAYLVWRFTRGK